MANHNLFQPISMHSDDLNVLIKTGQCAAALDNGNLVLLGDPLTTLMGKADLGAYVAIAATGDGLLAIVDDPEVMEDELGYRLDNVRDPRTRFIPANRPFRVRIPQKFDEFAVTAALVTGTPNGTNKYVIVDASNHGSYAAVAAGGTSSADFIGEIIDFDYVFSVGTTKVAGYRIRVIKA